ncbi:hypothetical protein AAMO2058_000978600 [Amorphochlora amoebiformis]
MHKTRKPRRKAGTYRRCVACMNGIHRSNIFSRKYLLASKLDKFERLANERASKTSNHDRPPRKPKRASIFYTQSHPSFCSIFIVTMCVFSSRMTRFYGETKDR